MPFCLPPDGFHRRQDPCNSPGHYHVHRQPTNPVAGCSGRPRVLFLCVAPRMGVERVVVPVACRLEGDLKLVSASSR